MDKNDTYKVQKQYNGQKQIDTYKVQKQYNGQ